MAYSTNPTGRTHCPRAKYCSANRARGEQATEKNEILLDSFHDRHNAFYFSTNPLVDGLVIENGQLNCLQSRLASGRAGRAQVPRGRNKTVRQIPIHISILVFVSNRII